MISVVAALIKNDDKILITRRKTGDKYVINKWEFPGGKVENNETEIDAIKREIKEELEIDIEAIKLLDNVVYKYPSKEISLNLYECIPKSANIILHDHIEFRWVLFSSLSNYDFAPADKLLIKKLLMEK